MAKTTEAQATIKDRLQALLRTDDRFEHVNAHRRWSAKAANRTVLTHRREERLRQLRAEIDASSDPGALPRVILLIKREILSSPFYMQYVPPSKAHRIFALEHFRGLADQAEHDMARFKTDAGEVYDLAAWEAASDPQWAHAFGDCNDVAFALRELEDLQARRPLLVEGLRTATGDDVTFREELLADGRRVQSAHYAITGGEVRLGDVDALLAWAQRNRAAVLGV